MSSPEQPHEKPGNRNFTLNYPWLGTGPVSVESSVSPECFELEREHVFKKVWLNIGRLERAPKPGDYFVKEMPVAKTSLLVIHGEDGVIRTFHNICTHRGNKLAWDDEGNCQGFSCSFHGWTFDTKGDLVTVTDEDQFYNLDKSENGLKEIHTEVWEGFIFINFAKQPKETLKEYLAEMGERLEGYPFDEMSLRWSYSAEVNCNWKVGQDAFQEQYHFNYVHRRTVAPAFMSKDNPNGHIVWGEFYKRHGMFSAYGNFEFHPRPIELLAHKFGRVFHRQHDVDAVPKGMNPTNSPTWVLDGVSIFPNFVLNIHGDRIFSWHFWPVSADKMIFEAFMHTRAPESPAEAFNHEVNKCLVRDTYLEDMSTWEETQEVLGSGAITDFVLQDSEAQLRRVRKVVEHFITEGQNDEKEIS